MPLPKIVTPTYTLVIPSSGKKITYRPFLVKEEKVLVMAMESDNMDQVGRAIKDVLSACINTRGVRVEKLSTFDIEYLFLHIRGKSVGETIEVMATCPDDGETKVPMTIAIDDIEVQQDPKHNKDIKLDDNLTLRMRYPSLTEFVDQNFGEGNKVTQSFDVISSCIDMVFSEEETWDAKDHSKKEWNSFVETLPSQAFKKIETFFDTMPKLTHSVTVKNPNTGIESQVVLEGLASFFT
tara:strand:- start:2336 stop:3049 length:714 start_codon:yes stop_codon:yes gene_type:complete